MKITIDENDKITVELDNGHVQVFPPEFQEDCVKAAVQQEKAADWEKRCEELRRRLEEETDRADGWELRCAELEQELRDAQEQLDESVRKEAALGLEANKLRDRIWSQNVTIARYDDENKTLWKWKQNRDLGELLHKNVPRDSLTDCAKKIHQNAVGHGWWETKEGVCDDGERPLPEILMLCVCELAESMEEYRNGKPLIYDGEDGKPEGIAVEMGDCIIRVLDWMGHNGIDVDDLIRKKHEYNKGRPYRHGGKKA